MEQGSSIPVSRWLGRFQKKNIVDPLITSVYGEDQDNCCRRMVLWIHVLEFFMRRFGDLPVRLFRSPGRINLRGMHVDTHGGYLNLMTHQRETVLVAADSGSTRSTFVNIERDYRDVQFDLDIEYDGWIQGNKWGEFIACNSAVERREKRRTDGLHWGNYVVGAALAALDSPNGKNKGILAAIGSDLPRGGALSSSASLCVSILHAFSAFNGRSTIPERLIRAEQDAEWYAGARVGMSDQGAMILGRRNRVVNVVLFADNFSLDKIEYIRMNPELSVLVVNSYTQRSLSGPQLIEYTRNRFAYSMAMAVVRKELLAMGIPSEQVGTADRLSLITPEYLGGLSELYELLKRIPEELSLEEIRDRYQPPEMETVYERYFGGVPLENRPSRIRLRGPLLFGIAESERARIFPRVLENGDWVRLGQLMSLGHDGDRVLNLDGTPFVCDISDDQLNRMADAKVAIQDCPGVYGASSPVLDLLVDKARETGALGACLTGAGIAGAVLLLCKRADIDHIADAIRDCLQSEEYRNRGGRARPFSEEELHQAVVENHSTAGAGELVF